MPAILALLEQAFAQIIAILGLSQLIYGVLQNLGIAVNIAAREHAPYRIETVTLSTNLETIDPDHGLAAIATKIDQLGLAVSALGNPQQTADPVTLPTVPPAGYGGASVSDVWSFVLPSSGSTASSALDNANEYAVALADKPWPRLPGQPYLKLIVHFNWLGIGFYVPDPQPALDVTTILPTDATPEAWVLREYSSYGWITVNQSGNWQPLAYHDLSTSNVYFALDMSQSEFLAIQSILYPAAGPILPPVWPGLAGVTLLTPHTMVPPGENVTIDCDGVIIDITGTPSWAGNFSFGTAISWRNVGAVTFTTDNGQEEFAQTFSWSSGVYLPKSQQHASGYAYRASLGVSGTITPFTIN